MSTDRPPPFVLPEPPDASFATADGRYTDRGRIARGGMGTVRKAWDGLVGRDVAVKVTDADKRAQLVEEVRVAAKLDHPNVVPVHDVGVDTRGRPYFSMKLVTGLTLEAVARAPLAPDESRHERLHRLLDVLSKVCDAIACAHSRDVFHCDLKPDNVMIGDFGQVYVMDWGIARRRGGAVPVNATSGTAGYMAPEQARPGAHVDERTDVYGLGGLLYFLLTRDVPHPGATPEERAVAAREGLVSPMGRGVPPALRAIALKALAADPASRFPDVASFKREIARAMRAGVWLEERTYPAGATVVRTGDPGDEAFVIQAGVAEAIVNGRVVAHMEAGDTFGELSLLTGEPRAADVVAYGPLHVAVVSRDTLEAAAEDGGWVGLMLKSLARRLRETASRE
ncbi:MAG: serine/threonine-protein kinase [Myxococcota bacterium]